MTGDSECKWKISKWGNSLGVRLPLALATEAGIAEGQIVDITVKNAQILIKKSKKYSLDELVSKILPENLHGEFDTGSPKGHEVW